MKLCRWGLDGKLPLRVALCRAMELVAACLVGAQACGIDLLGSWHAPREASCWWAAWLPWQACTGLCLRPQGLCAGPMKYMILMGCLAT